MEDKYKEAFKMVEENYKYLDSTRLLIIDTQSRIAELLKIENRTKINEIQLATAIYTLKALSKLSIAESIINSKSK